jgi:hypothetical protein
MARFILALVFTGLELFLTYRTVVSYQLAKTLAGLDDPRVLLTKHERRELALSAARQEEYERNIRTMRGF